MTMSGWQPDERIGYRVGWPHFPGWPLPFLGGEEMDDLMDCLILISTILAGVVLAVVSVILIVEYLSWGQALFVAYHSGGSGLFEFFAAGSTEVSIGGLAFLYFFVMGIAAIIDS